MSETTGKSENPELSRLEVNDLINRINETATLASSNGMVDEAVSLYKQALSLDASRDDVWFALGRLLKAGRNNQSAEECIRQAISLAPGVARYRTLLAALLFIDGRKTEGEECLDQALALDPEDPEILSDVGVARIDRNDGAGAEPVLRKARAKLRKTNRHSDIATTDCRLATALAYQSKYDEAMEILKALDRRYPNNASIHFVLAQILSRSGKYAHSLSMFKRARSLLSPSALRTMEPSISMQENVAFFSSGNLKAGWDNYTEFGFSAKKRLPERLSPWPRWQGEPVTGKKFLIWGEQGIGDHVNFAEPIRDLAASGAHVTLEVSPRLTEIFRRSLPGVEVYHQSMNSVPESMGLQFDFGLAMGDLMPWLRPQKANFPGTPFLKPDSERVAAAAKRLEGMGPRPRIGLSWRTGNGSREILRSILMSQLAPALAGCDATFVNLQYGEVGADLVEAAKHGLHIHRDHDLDTFNDIDGMMAEMAALDLVLTIDNSTVHFAGAIGVPTLLLLPRHCDFRWFDDEDRCTWYHSVRILKQRRQGDWKGPLKDAAKNIAALTGEAP